MHAGILGRVVDVQQVGHFFPVFLNPLMDFISVGEFIYGSDIVGTAACGKTGSPVVVDALPHGADCGFIVLGKAVNQTAGNTRIPNDRGFVSGQCVTTTCDHVFGQQNDCICTRGKCLITACGDRIVCVVNTGADDVQLFFRECVIRAKQVITVTSEKPTFGHCHDGMISPHCAGNIGVVGVVTCGRGSGHEDLFDFAPILAGSAGITGVSGVAGSL